jgi:hypothetical protein
MFQQSLYSEIITIIYPTRTSRNHTGFKKLIQNFFFVNIRMPVVYKEFEKYFAQK